jgi:hypothetical protein
MLAGKTAINNATTPTPLVCAIEEEEAPKPARISKKPLMRTIPRRQGNLRRHDPKIELRPNKISKPATTKNAAASSQPIFRAAENPR